MPVFTSDSGRNALDVLPFLVPAVTPTAVFGSAQTHFNLLGSQMSINGARPNSNSFYLDGGDNNDHEFNQIASPFPNPEALLEFTIITNNYQADLGRSSGGIINAVVKSGTSQYRGNVRHFLINEAFNARSFFDLRVPPDKLNTSGGQIGGPIRLPGIGKKQAFFFVDYERTSSGGGYYLNLNLLSEKERSGNFSDLPLEKQPRDPLTGKPFPEGIISANRFDPIAKAYLDRYVPLPNETERGLRVPLVTHLRNDQVATRADYEVSESDHVSGTYISNKSKSLSGTGNLPVGSMRDVGSCSHNLVLREAHIFSRRTINQFTGTITRLVYDGTDSSPGATGIQPREIGFTGINPQTGKYLGVPSVSVDGTAVRVPSGEGSTTAKTTWEIKDDLSTTRDSHVIKFGGGIRAFLQNTAIGNDNGSFTFSNSNSFGTSNAIADFLLGLPDTYRQTTGKTKYPRGRVGSLYTIDEWQLKPNLTINLGLRYELAPPLTDKLDQVSVFRPGANSQRFPGAATGLLFVGDRDPILGSVPRGLYPTDKNNFAPRFAVAYSPGFKSGWRHVLFGQGKSALRLGIGVFYDQTYGAFLSELASTQPFSVTQSLFADQIHIAGGTFANPFGKLRNPWPVDLNKPLFIDTPQLQPIDPGFRTAYTYHYNVTFQSELPWTLLLEAAYVGNHSFKLSRARELNTAVPVMGGGLLELRRIYPQFDSIVSQESSGRAQYDSLQIRLRRRLKGGLLLDGSYVLGKAFDDDSGPLAGASTNPLRWARSAFDRRHNFVMSYTYDLPAPRLSGLAGHIVDGWQIGGITELRSGLPMDISQSSDSSLTAESLFGSPDVVGQFVRLDPRKEQTIQVNGVPQTGHFFFDPNAFRPVVINGAGDARPGTLGRNVFDGPGMSLWSIAINKQIHISASQQISFRADIRNLFNHPNFQMPGLQADVSSTFGQVFLAAPGRNVQLSLKYSF